MTEQIYQDFITKFLPTIQEGLVITKDYFTDLFGRYIQYLIIVDTFWVVFWAFLMIVGISLVVWLYRVAKKENEIGEDWHVVLTMLGIVSVILPSFLGFSEKLQDLIQDKYVPEIRVWQELKNYK